MTDHQDRSIRQSHYRCHLHRHFLRSHPDHWCKRDPPSQSGHQDHCRCHHCIGRQSSIGSLGRRCCSPDRPNLPIHLHRCQFHRNKAGRPLLGVNLRCSRDHLHRLIHRRHYHCRRCMVSLCQARFHHQPHRRRHNQDRRRQSIHRHHYLAHPRCPICSSAALSQLLSSASRVPSPLLSMPSLHCVSPKPSSSYPEAQSGSASST